MGRPLPPHRRYRESVVWNSSHVQLRASTAPEASLPYSFALMRDRTMNAVKFIANEITSSTSTVP